MPEAPAGRGFLVIPAVSWRTGLHAYARTVRILDLRQTLISPTGKGNVRNDEPFVPLRSVQRVAANSQRILAGPPMMKDCASRNSYGAAFDQATERESEKREVITMNFIANVYDGGAADVSLFKNYFMPEYRVIL